ncbi:rhodanese-like domain-containing protein [Vibrio superstes]|uniref:Rhodanese-like domain-containing protein n=1 Tax=Vibrio superstes NBRC 103154 TaxID=1219062 RepID=A0A511QQG5_9VIBR|nr:rhodanese-like domain-containing protein [Vibrio superstes]GEM79595.1 rhodanese-like domain-containing protein [Vibrio superstes NBRC 103154]
MLTTNRMIASLLLAVTLLTVSIATSAAEVTGKIQSIIHSSKVIQYLNPKTKEVKVLKYTDETTLLEADSFKDLTVNTKFKAVVNDDNVATQIKRVLVKLPPEQVIDTDTLADLMDEGKPIFIGDARPLSVYNAGHLPTAKATPSNQLKENLDWLPSDKEMLLVFYCGGVTCPLSPAALKIAVAAGYTNVKAYVEGFPAWKADVYPSHVNPEWMEKNLDIHHVILDVRENPTSSVKGAVHVPASQLVTMHEQWNAEKFAVGKRMVMGLRDKKAPVIIVADMDNSDEAIEAFEILTFWKYKNAVILKGGMQEWTLAKRPTQDEDFSTELVYEKKMAPGAVEESVFVTAAKQGDATIIDVRNPDEVASGHIKGSINIPLSELDEQLAKVPKEGLVILHCEAGARAALGYTLLSKKGYTNVKYLNDSFKGVVADNGIGLL